MTLRISTPPGRPDIAEAAWALARTLPQFGYAEISVELKVSARLVGRIVRVWRTEGRLIEIRPPALSQRGLWRVDPAWQPVQDPGLRTVEECLWAAMRQAKSFTPRVLAVSAATPLVQVTPEASQAYCRVLLAAGYLKVTRKAVPGKTEPIYHLIRYTGPRPPREKRVRAVIDFNTDQTILIGGGQ